MSSLRRSQSLPSLTRTPQGSELSSDAQTPADGQRAKGLSEPKAVRVDIREIHWARVEDWVQVAHPGDRPISVDLHKRAVTYTAMGQQSVHALAIQVALEKFILHRGDRAMVLSIIALSEDPKGVDVACRYFTLDKPKDGSFTKEVLAEQGRSHLCDMHRWYGEEDESIERTSLLCLAFLICYLIHLLSPAFLVISISAFFCVVLYRAFAGETLGPQPLTNARLGRWLYSVVVSLGFLFTSVGLWIFFVVLSSESAVLIIALAVLVALLSVCGFVVAAILL